MTLPWFLNPWAEVRRLRAELKWRDHMRLDMAKAWRDERRENYQRIREANVLKDENADLRRRIAEMSKWTTHDPRIAKLVRVEQVCKIQGAKF